MSGHRGRSRAQRFTIMSLLLATSIFVVVLLGLNSSELATSSETQQLAQARHARKVVIVVMPSPPMVTTPMTRIDRMVAISDTWGQLFLSLGSRGHAGAATLDNGHRLVFVMEKNDQFASEATRLWSIEDFSTKEGKPDNTPRLLMVPSEVSDGGADTEARMRHFLAGAHFRYDPDFLFFCNEHTFVIPENLLCYLEGLSPTEPLYLGNRFRRERQEGAMLNPGASGVLLSRETLQRLSAAWGSDVGKITDGPPAGDTRDTAFAVEKETRPECVASSKFEKENPGVTLARCLQRLGIEAQDTTDDQGGQRFNSYGPTRMAEGKVDQWYKDVHASKPGLWIAGPGCCAENTISFHYVGPAEARAIHVLLHNRERYLTAGYEEALRLWPSPESLGGYAMAPSTGDLSTFDLLLQKIKLCGA